MILNKGMEDFLLSMSVNAHLLPQNSKRFWVFKCCFCALETLFWKLSDSLQPPRCQANSNKTFTSRSSYFSWQAFFRKLGQIFSPQHRKYLRSPHVHTYACCCVDVLSTLFWNSQYNSLPTSSLMRKKPSQALTDVGE